MSIIIIIIIITFRAGVTTGAKRRNVRYSICEVRRQCEGMTFDSEFNAYRH